MVAVFVATPLLATVLGGFKSLGELRTNPFGLPKVWECEHYASSCSPSATGSCCATRAIISTLSVLLTLIAASMAAFVFAHIRFYGRTMLLNYLTMGLLFPAATAILPLFIKVRDLGLLDTYFGVVLPQVAFSLAMSILLLRRFFKDLPDELLEAALVDGCSYFAYLPPRHLAAVAADPGDGRHHRVRAQLEQPTWCRW